MARAAAEKAAGERVVEGMAAALRVGVATAAAMAAAERAAAEKVAGKMEVVEARALAVRVW